MNRFFNNKWFVLALGCSALAICGINIVGPLMEGSAPGAESVVAAYGLDGDVTSVNRAFGLNDEVPNEKSADLISVGATELPQNLNTLGWNPSITRNPFSLEKTNMLDVAEQLEEVSALQADEVSIADPTVTAVVIANNIRVAVIDGAIVHIGSTLNDGEVAAINGRSIAVKDPDARIRDIQWAREPQ